ncbi:hypothetical protein [Rhodococcus sp. 114MFTsu3.1]|nr:hypothetical protein [Rhodococcus sp. 114MFTsu3.1]
MNLNAMTSAELRALKINNLTQEQRDRLIVTLDMIIERYSRQNSRTTTE